MPLTCVTCRVVFANSSLHREHYRDDWHRYNLKRKVAELPPVSAEIFQQKAQEQKLNDDKTEGKANIFLCKPCHKSFSSSKAYENHVGSKRHANNILNYKGTLEQHSCIVTTKDSFKDKKKSDTITDDECELDVEEVDSDEWEEDENLVGLPSNVCLFCNSESKSFEENLKHMSSTHSFFIPDIEYVADLEGLVSYLGKKIGGYYVCLWCCGKGKHFKSLPAVQKHMLDMGHTKMLHEGGVLHEYAQFYDYSSSYPDNEEIETDMEAVIPIIESNGYELVLPSGTVIGHRSLFRYYRQKLPPRTLNVNTSNRLLTHYKALGWNCSTPAAIEKKAKDLKFMNKMRMKINLGVGVRANKLQKHFRPQVNF